MKIIPRSDMLRPEIICIDDFGDEMEMPTLCDCGEWFDLNDGFCSKTKNETICEACHDLEEDIEDYENEIDDLETYIENRENVRQNKKQLKLIKVKLKEKKSQLNNRRF